MSDEVPHGPVVPDDEDVNRAVLYPHWWKADVQRPSSAAFDAAVFSVDVASKTTPAETLARFNPGTGLVQFNCGEARTLGFDTRDEPDDQFPDNVAHAHVYFEYYAELKRSRRKRRARDLALMFCVAVIPGLGDDED